VRPLPRRTEHLTLKPTAFYAAHAIYTRARSAWWEARTRRHAVTNGLRILFYHRVSRDRDELAVTPHRFREQMEHLAGAGYRVVGAVDAAAALDAPEAGRVVGLTFDDGYADVVDNALPVLVELGFRATIFLPTGAIDGTHPLSWYERQPPLLEWSTIAELDRSGTLDFGAHTVSHRNLLALDDATAEGEIARSKHALEARLGHPVYSFCYPAGLYGERERRLVRSAGFRVAVGTDPGANDADSDRLALRRIGVEPRDRLLDFRAKVGGGHDRAPPLRGIYRTIRFGGPRGFSQPVAS